MSARNATRSSRLLTAEKIAKTLLSDDELSRLEEQAATATGLKKAWKKSLVTRQYSRRATVERLTRINTDGFDRQVADLDARGFDGPGGGGRMSTVMPPGRIPRHECAGRRDLSVDRRREGPPLLGTPRWAGT